MYFKERSSRAQRQAGEVQGQDTVIPCAFSFFGILLRLRRRMNIKSRITVMWKEP